MRPHCENCRVLEAPCWQCRPTRRSVDWAWWLLLTVLAAGALFWGVMIRVVWSVLS
jgi:hypothetical protein